MNVKVLTSPAELRSQVSMKDSSIFLLDGSKMTLSDLGPEVQVLGLRIAENVLLRSKASVLVGGLHGQLCKAGSLSEILSSVFSYSPSSIDNELRNVYVVLDEKDADKVTMLKQQFTYLRFFPKVYTAREFDELKKLQTLIRTISTILTFSEHLFSKLQKAERLGFGKLVRWLGQRLRWLACVPSPEFLVTVGVFSTMNSGKSTLVNCILDREVAKVTSDVDTKRIVLYVPTLDAAVVGSSSDGNVQVDRYHFESALPLKILDTISYDLSQSTKESIRNLLKTQSKNIDVFVFVSDYPKHAQEAEAELLKLLSEYRTPEKVLLAVLNKLDLMFIDQNLVKNSTRATEFVKRKFSDTGANVVFVPVSLRTQWTLAKLKEKFGISVAKNILDLVNSTDALSEADSIRTQFVESMIRDLKVHYKVRNATLDDIEVFGNFSSFMNLLANEVEDLFYKKALKVGERAVLKALENQLDDVMKELGTVVKREKYMISNTLKNLVSPLAELERFRSESVRWIGEFKPNLEELLASVRSKYEHIQNRLMRLAEDLQSRFQKAKEESIALISKPGPSLRKFLRRYEMFLQSFENEMKKTFDVSEIKSTLGNLREEIAAFKTNVLNVVKSRLSKKIDNLLTGLSDNSFADLPTEAVNKGLNDLADLGKKLSLSKNYDGVFIYLDKIDEFVDKILGLVNSIKFDFLDKPDFQYSRNPIVVFFDLLTLRYYKKFKLVLSKVSEEFSFALGKAENALSVFLGSGMNQLNSQRDRVVTLLKDEFANFERLFISQCQMRLARIEEELKRAIEGQVSLLKAKLAFLETLESEFRDLVTQCKVT